MQPRNNLVEIFSTFLQFDADRFRSWATDAKLRRSMINCAKQIPQETSENFWALYWYKQWHSQSQQIAKEHLLAYLQECCYWSSAKAANTFASIQYNLSDCFQIAIAKFDKVLQGYNPDSGFRLKNYASATFGSVIRDTLRQRHEVDICSVWGLLRKTSHKRLVESLQQSGLPEDTIAAYVVAWNRFKTFYVPTQASSTRQLPRPDEKIWSTITQTYNKQTDSSVDSQTLETWLLNCAASIRKYLYPSVISINAPAGGEDAFEWIDNLTSGEDSLLNQIIATEEEQVKASQESEMNAVLASKITQLDKQLQQILQLYYGQGLTQQQIAQQLEVKQYTVSRRLSKTKETLLRSVFQWSQEKLHISLTPDILKTTSSVMEEWLYSYYS
ncbi:MAG: sigma-70 family RNA polymerase sigma factor [Richelia sp. RM2_1_2]|nr:sigma-70 family RNA polymerase sigma factor [Richelia sp. SM2_1_7]NJM21410.1 sigma-70 family RNA polymerase sigma factor [Richelia sp. SM1_7_0]NJN10735.1 sigma-70 family RNA polymerase sigma factor [Richelia sp. RM1_1_1]NJO29136.1 sigma-70 family RNA polymerase sigma factor [Richelia sp. SL_2_1]NJO58156.1 sigma-70 family RNA polymerase sigma factor [Richelia sp. RM2_1_2]